MENKSPTFTAFLEKFPLIDLPVTLGEDTHHEFSKKNDPLAPALVDQFIAPLEEEAIDEFTEFLACFRIPDTHDFHALVYWRASLLNYRYTLATYDKKGRVIDKRVIAGTFSDKQVLITSVATLEPEWEIFIASGQAEAGRKSKYDASSSTAQKLELLPEGKIVDI